MMERLTTREEHPHGAEGRSKDNLTGKYCRGVFEATAVVEKLSYYENMEEDGKMVFIPCKTGDTVYAYCEELHRILPYFVEQVVIDYDSDNSSEYIIINATCVEDIELIDSIDFEPKDVGKTVFLTENEANEALERVKE